MSEIKSHRPVLLMAGIFGKQAASIDWACEKLVAEHGPIEIRSKDQPFDQTRFYQDKMGTDLIKRFIAFRQLIDPASLPKAKIRSNELEKILANETTEDCPRPVNIDPGYVTEAKLVLATTKDRDHRIYLGEGIFGEITLYFQNHQWNSSRWTYPDYQTAGAIEFLNLCRHHLRTLYLDVKNDV